MRDERWRERCPFCGHFHELLADGACSHHEESFSGGLVPLAKASPTEKDAAWKSLIDTPFYLEVEEGSTIVVPVFKTLEMRSDVFNISLAGIMTPDRLIREIEDCEPMANRFR